MQSDATTVAEYLAELPADRRATIATVRQTILAHLPLGYEEAINWGMITYQVPLQRHPDTYNGQPLAYAALASQKNHMAVYLSGIYMDDETRSGSKRPIGRRASAMTWASRVCDSESWTICRWH